MNEASCITSSTPALQSELYPLSNGPTFFLNQPLRQMAEADVASGGEELIETRLKPLLSLLESCLVSKHIGKDHMETITRSKGLFYWRGVFKTLFSPKDSPS